MPMRQLRRCDFCGGDAAGVYEVLPPELSPTEAEQQRLVLCSNCAGTLETVIDPLLERLGVETGERTSATDGAAGASSDPEDRPEAPGARDREAVDVDSADTAAPATPSSQAGGSASGDFDGASDSEGTGQPQPGDSAFGAEPDPGPIEWGTSGPDSDMPEEPAATDVATGAEADDEGADDTNTGADDTETGSDDTETGSDDTDATAVDSGGNEGETDATGGDGVGDEPDEFRTVMRLLGNREFPVDRGAIVELAASAYELDEQHVHRILDYAVDRGVIAEDGHTLRRN